MEVYDVELDDDDRLAKPKRLQLFAANLTIFAVVFLVLQWRESMPFWSMANAALAFLLFSASVAMTMQGSSKKFRLKLTYSWQKYRIIVEEDRIRTRDFNSMNWALSKTVQRGEIRTIVEKEKGLLISSRDRLGTYLWGGIWIPKRLTDYEYLKGLMLSWKVQETA